MPPPGLKEQFGVSDPAPASSDKQSQDFKASFQAEIDPTNGNLQYTAVNAEEAAHAPLAARRDALLPAYQTALGTIDPADEAKGQPAIDKVMGDAKALNGEVGKFKADAEKAYNDWQPRQPKLDAAVHQVEELEAWGHAKAPPLRGLVDGIRGETDKKRYAPAATTLDQLLPKLQTIYEDYLRQKEAKEKYEAASAAVQPRVAKASESKHAKLEPMQKEITDLQGQMTAAAESKDYVKALESANGLTSKLEAFEAALTELEAKKKEFETALAALQPRLDKAGQPTQSPKLAPLQQEIATLKGPMEAAATAEDYEGALKQATDLTAKVEAYEAAVAELEAKKKEYEGKVAALQPRLAKVAESKYAKLEPMQKEIAEGQKAMEDAATGEDYDGALAKATDLESKLTAFEAALAELEAKKKEYEDKLAALQPRLAKAAESKYAKLESQQKEVADAQKAMEDAATSGDYEAALAKAADLETKLTAFETALAEIEAKKKEYEDKLAALQPRLTKASESKYAKLEPQQKEIADAQKAMEDTATGGDYDGALAKATDLETKLTAFEAAVAELEAKKKEYEDKLAALQPRLGKATEPKDGKLTPPQEEIVALQKQMETAAQGGDYEQAAKLTNDLSAKLDAYAKDPGKDSAPAEGGGGSGGGSKGSGSGSGEDDSPGPRKLETLDRGDGKPSAGSAPANDPNLLGIPAAAPAGGSSSGDGAAGSGSGGGLTPEMMAKCDGYLKANRFRAEKAVEIVPGDMQCDVFLNDHFIKIGEVTSALETQFPELKNDPVGVAHFVRDRWDAELHKALVLAGAMPADPEPKAETELKEQHNLTVPNPIPVQAKTEESRGERPHLGADAQGGAGKDVLGKDLEKRVVWSFQATLIAKNVDLKTYGQPKKLSVDLFHEPNISLTLDSKGALTAQEAIALLNVHWIPPWKKEIEVPLSVFLNAAITPHYLHQSGGAQLQVEQHICKWFSITVSASGTLESGAFKLGAGASVLFHIIQ